MKFRNRAIIILLALAAAAAAGFFLFQPSPAKSAEKLLNRGRGAIVTENMDRLATIISLYYRDDLGLNYPALRASFEYVFSQFSDIAIDYRVTGITGRKDTVIADLTVWARGTWMGATQDIAGTENDPVTLSILCRKEMFAWKIIGSRWPHGTAGLRELY